MAWIDDIFKRMAQLGASDLHLTSDDVPRFRLNGDIVPVEGCPELDAEQLRNILYEITPAHNRAQFEAEHDTDFAYELPGVARFRSNLFMDLRGPGAVFRLIPSEILSAEKLGLPKAALDLCYLTKGLVLVTGPTGSGKSTTLAAMIDFINRNRSDHIITIEDPVEFVHPSKRCLIHQREVHRHTHSFKRALRAALREDPDIVLVGELRDLETIEIAIETAETGHLVFGTLHTTTAPSTVDRIIDQFPADRQAQIRTMLSSSLKGVIAQTLCKKKPKGRIAALEIMIGNAAVSANIREGKTFQLVSAMQMGAKYGMRLLNDSLFELVKNRQVDPQEAYMKCVSKEDLLNKFQTAGISIDLSRFAEDGPAAKPAPTPAAAAGGGLSTAPRQLGGSGGGPPLGMPRGPLPQTAAPPAAPAQAPSANPLPPKTVHDPFEQFKRQRGG
jgi:twitching motility protein PilT